MRYLRNGEHALFFASQQIIIEMNLKRINELELKKSSDLVREEWGDVYAKHFLMEVQYVLSSGQGAAYVVTSESEVPRAIGVIVKEQIDWSLWGIPWIVVARNSRGQGIGAVLLKRLEEHALEGRSQFPTENCVISLSAKSPEFFERCGYAEVARWGQGIPNCLMIKKLCEGKT